MLGVAQAPDQEHAEESEDGPAASTKLRPLRTDFAFGKAKDARDDQSGDEQRPEPRSGDEDKVASVAAWIERQKGTDAVVVRPVEEDVAKKREEGGEIDPAPEHRLKLRA